MPSFCKIPECARKAIRLSRRAKRQASLSKCRRHQTLPTSSSRRPSRHQNSSSLRKASAKKAINPFCGAPTTTTTTTCTTAIYYRGENEHEWKLLKDKLDQKFYSWDTTTLPDGAYYLKIVATDAPSNPPAAALKTERESERFEVDNTPPVIERLEATSPRHVAATPAPSIVAKFTAHDSASSIDRAQYSLDGGDWTLLAPAGNVSDAPSENYEFTLGSLAPGEHTIAVRAYDRFENVGSAKTTFNVTEAKP